MKTSDVGLALIKHYEGFYNKPYRCPAGFFTVGYGHLIGDGLSLPDHWNRHFSVEEIDALLRQDLARFERGVQRYIIVPLSQPQFDALVSFSFNLGLSVLRRSTVRQKINRLDFKGAIQSLLRYDKAGSVALKGLTLRRRAEAKLMTA